MKNNKKFEEILMAEIQEIKKDIKEVRQTDIPNLQISMAVEKVKNSNTAKIITGIGGAITLLVSVAAAYLTK